MSHLNFIRGLVVAAAGILVPMVQDAISIEALRRHTEELASDGYEGRGAGYPGEQRAGEYIAAQFKRIGLVPAGDGGSYFQEFSFQPSHPVKPWEVFKSRNVIGRVDGADPVLKREVVVIGAHYDGQGRTGQADPFRLTAPDDAADDEIWNSANDNASGVAAMLEIARVLEQSGAPPGRSVLFIAFGAEEHGMSGSIHYVAHPAAPLTDHVAMINLEKLGRAPDKPFSTAGDATSAIWAAVLESAKQHASAQVVTANPFAIPESDHYPFAASRIPAIMLYVGTPAHQRSDSADRLDFNRVAQGARLAQSMMLDLARLPQRPSYAPSPMPDMGLSALLVSAAEADARGVAPPYGGLKVTGVIAGLPADKAGLQPGDFIVEFAKYQFRRDDQVPALMAMMREILEGKRGYSLPLTVVRGTKRLDLVMNLR
jgi:hypothetical protein